MRSALRRLTPAVTTLAVAALLALPGPAPAADRVEDFALSAGVFNVLNEDRAAEGGAEARLRPLFEGTTPRPWVLRTAVGAMANSDGGLYGYAGFRLEVPVGARWLVVPQTAAGVYDRGDGKELGGSIQFRSGLELAYRLTEAHSLGAVFYHLSNAGLERPNPGAESLTLVWSWR
ncbi:MAG TPA: acyloxyacyl hydrolase [Thermoanaerobaculia bacterium]|nr:acyloxyacyl hydrolase [Thermoanaerobaculia bacterium]